MHTSVHVVGVLPDRLLSAVFGLGFCRWASAEAVHEPAGVVLMRPRGGLTAVRFASALFGRWAAPTRMFGYARRSRCAFATCFEGAQSA
jgi:hypothetical protein